MISEGSRDTEDWNNDAENTALHHRNKIHIKKVILDWLTPNFCELQLANIKRFVRLHHKGFLGIYFFISEFKISWFVQLFVKG